MESRSGEQAILAYLLSNAFSLKVPCELPLLPAPDLLQRSVGHRVYGGGHQRRAPPSNLPPSKPATEAGKVHGLCAFPLLCGSMIPQGRHFWLKYLHELASGENVDLLLSNLILNPFEVTSES